MKHAGVKTNLKKETVCVDMFCIKHVQDGVLIDFRQ
jgi:hypothetical protein